MLFQRQHTNQPLPCTGRCRRVSGLYRRHVEHARIAFLNRLGPVHLKGYFPCAILVYIQDVVRHFLGDLAVNPTNAVSDDTESALEIANGLKYRAQTHIKVADTTSIDRLCVGLEWLALALLVNQPVERRAFVAVNRAPG